MVWILKNKSGKNELERIKDAIKSKKKSGIDLSKYCGIISLKESPLKIQKKLRSEWK